LLGANTYISISASGLPDGINICLPKIPI
jgi:hypothetical protein